MAINPSIGLALSVLITQGAFAASTQAPASAVQTASTPASVQLAPTGSASGATGAASTVLSR